MVSNVANHLYQFSKHTLFLLIPVDQLWTKLANLRSYYTKELKKENDSKKVEQALMIYAPPEFIDREINGTVVEAEWRQNAGNGNILANILQQGGNRSTLEANEIRDELCEYFNTDGQVPVPWRWNAI
jgi:hypothetical protein